VANYLDGYIRVFQDDDYLTEIDEASNPTIMDGASWAYSSPYIESARACQFVDYDWSLSGGTGSPTVGEILLDINDGTDYCVVEIEYPAPRPRLEWRDPAHGDGRDVSYFKWENREITLTVQIYGTDEEDLSTNFRALMEQLLAPNPILAWKAGGWLDALYFDLISPPLEINTPDWFETWIRENGKLCVMSNVELTLEARPFARGPEETVVLLNGSVASPDVVNCVTGIVLDETNFLGDAPAPADIFIDFVDGTLWTDLIFGQRLLYSDDFDPIQEPAGGTTIALANRLNGDFEDFPDPANLVLNPLFTTAGATPPAFLNWDEAVTGTGTVVRMPGGGVLTGPCCRLGGFTTWGSSAYVLCDAMAADPAHSYFVSVFHMGDSTTRSKVNTQIVARFYDGGVYTGAKIFRSHNYAPGSWTEYIYYISPADFPTAGTDQIRIYLYGGVVQLNAGYIYFDTVTVHELDSLEAQALFELESHEGRYLPVAAVAFDASATYDDVTMNAMLATYPAGAEITGSVTPVTISSENPIHTVFHELALLEPRYPVISIPTHKISNLADKTALGQILRLSTDAYNMEDFEIDYIGIVPIDRAYSEVRNWSGNEHLILDGRSSKLALSSWSGSLDDAMVYDINNQRGECNFVADPKGFNGTLIALTDVLGDNQVTSVVDVTMKYSPLWLLVPEE
jgi:hypothetical protein